MVQKSDNSTTDPLLELKQVTKRFGGITAVSELDLELHPGELVGLIGPNGAGKTTAFNLITGVYPATEGTIRFNGHLVNGIKRRTLGSIARGWFDFMVFGEPLTVLKPNEITELGVARTFQNIRLFQDMTVLDNVKVAFTHHDHYGLGRSVIRGGSFHRHEREMEEQALEFLDIFELKEFADERAGSLAYGQQRRLEIARALATEPKLLILDEPAAGFNPSESVELLNDIRRIKDQFELTILLIEHDMKFVMAICDRIYVLDYGQRIAEGTPDEIKKDPKVISAYLGTTLEEGEQ